MARRTGNVIDQLGFDFIDTPAIVIPDSVVSGSLQIVNQIPAPILNTVSGEASKKELLKAFRSFGYKHHMHTIFGDFCELSACSISNSVDKSHFDEREEQYMRIAKRYDREEMDTFAKMLGMLVMAFEGLGPVDVLGDIFSQLEIANKRTGQFFTPQPISDLCGRVAFGGLEEIINEKGYVTLQEPAAGGGSMIFGFCKAMTDFGFDYTTQLHVTAIDIDARCAYMAYVQMSLLGIPGIVYHGDTLRMEMHSEWITPVHVFGWWHWRLFRDRNREAKQCI